MFFCSFSVLPESQLLANFSWSTAKFYLKQSTSWSIALKNQEFKKSLRSMNFGVIFPNIIVHLVHYKVVVHLIIDHIVGRRVECINSCLGQLSDLPPPPLGQRIVLGFGVTLPSHDMMWCTRRRCETHGAAWLVQSIGMFTWSIIYGRLVYLMSNAK